MQLTRKIMWMVKQKLSHQLSCFSGLCNKGRKRIRNYSKSLTSVRISKEDKKKETSRTHKYFTVEGRALKRELKSPVMKFTWAESFIKLRRPEMEGGKNPVRPLLSKIKEVTEAPVQITPAQIGKQGSPVPQLSLLVQLVPLIRL